MSFSSFYTTLDIHFGDISLFSTREMFGLLFKNMPQYLTILRTLPRASSLSIFCTGVPKLNSVLQMWVKRCQVRGNICIPWSTAFPTMWSRLFLSIREHHLLSFSGDLYPVSTLCLQNNLYISSRSTLLFIPISPKGKQTKKQPPTEQQQNLMLSALCITHTSVWGEAIWAAGMSSNLCW